MEKIVLFLCAFVVCEAILVVGILFIFNDPYRLD